MIGILPAAGKAERMLGLPKMLLPIPGDTTLIRRMRDSMEALNPRKICVGANGVNMALLEPLDRHTTKFYHAYTETMSETVLLAQRYVESDERVLFGMPDTYIDDADVWHKLNAVLDDGADVAVGVFMTRPAQRSKLGMCRIGDLHLVAEVVDKPVETDLVWAWGVLAWRPVFWGCINPIHKHVGFAVQRAIEERLDVRAVFMDGQYFDAGSPDEYFELIAHLRERTYA